MLRRTRLWPALAFGLVGLSLGGCGHSNFNTAQMSDQECMARVMYFESLRSSDDGMRAVGTVVMNRLSNPRYPKSVCGVVGQNKQFADGALTKHVDKRSVSWTRATRLADAVLGGERHEPVGSAMFFHTVGYQFPYRNMKYVTLAGGNAFYEKQTPGTFQNHIDPVRGTTMLAQGPRAPEEPNRAKPTMLAAADTEATEADGDDVASAPVRTASDTLSERHARFVIAAREKAGERVVTSNTRPAAESRRERATPEQQAQPRRSVVLASAAGPSRVPVQSRSVVERPRSAAAPPLPRTAEPARAIPLPVRTAEKPQPMVVAALTPVRPRPSPRVRSIEDLIAMDLAQQ